MSTKKVSRRNVAIRGKAQERACESERRFLQETPHTNTQTDTHTHTTHQPNQLTPTRKMHTPRTSTQPTNLLHFLLRLFPSAVICDCNTFACHILHLRRSLIWSCLDIGFVTVLQNSEIVEVRREMYTSARWNHCGVLFFDVPVCRTVCGSTIISAVSAVAAVRAAARGLAFCGYQ